jgi:hypothetical protein
MNKGLLVAVLIAALAPAAFAQEQLVGKDAGEFKASVCINQPDAITLEQCAGEVVLIKYWGTK